MKSLSRDRTRQQERQTSTRPELRVQYSEVRTAEDGIDLYETNIVSTTQK